MKQYIIALFAIWGALTAGNVMAHGTAGWLEESVAIRVTAQYDDGNPISYAKVEIKGPESDTAFQTGHTDRNGLFMFIPDGAGTWRVTVDDGLGHKLVLAEQVTAEKTLVQSPARPYRNNRSLDVIGGLGIISILGGALFALHQRRIRHRQDLEKSSSVVKQQRG